MLKETIYFLVVFITLLPIFTDIGNCSTLSGTVTFSDDATADSIIFTIDSYYFSNHVIYSKQSNRNFSFNLEPGKYQLSIKSVNSSPFFANVLIDAQNKKLSLNINLNPKGQESTARVEGFKYHDEYNAIISEINKFNKLLFSVNPGKATLEIMQKHNSQKTAELMKIKEKYSEYFEQIFIETQLSHLAMIHPLTVLFREHVSDGTIDSSDIMQIYSNDIFQEYFSEKIKLLKQLDPNSILLDGTFSMALGRMEVFESELYKDSKIDRDYFYTFLTDFINNTSNRYCAANLLYSSGEKYANDYPDRAMFLFTWLKDDYPDYRTVTNGDLLKIQNRIKLADLQIAPDFTVTSVAGQPIRLSDHNDKFVFLDFWATWCGACKTEITHIKELYSNCSSDDLKIIGLANDEAGTLSAFIKKNNIPYVNAIADEELLNLYGITGYPTTILIAPGGKIIHKYLRGQKLPDVIKSQIEEYKNRSN